VTQDLALTAPACFADCGCSCGTTYDAFDHVAADELREPLRLNDLCRQNIGWYTDRSLTESYLGDWGLHGLSGLYFLWHKDDYCPVHEMFHMRALYVGKGSIPHRLQRHWANQPTAEQMLIYFSFVLLPNRIAKYAEQLILDTYDLPFNRAENPGTATLCAYFDQGEVD
jgi:hypothetical protein